MVAPNPNYYKKEVVQICLFEVQPRKNFRTDFNKNLHKNVL